MIKYEYHIFVCENERDAADPRGSCSAKGSKAIRERFKQRIKELGLKSTVRANMAGCLDACAQGPSIVIYPQGVWYGKVREEDVDEIIEKHILRGEIVERLLMPGQDYLKKREREHGFNG